MLFAHIRSTPARFEVDSSLIKLVVTLNTTQSNRW